MLKITFNIPRFDSLYFSLNFIYMTALAQLQQKIESTKNAKQLMALPEFENKWLTTHMKAHGVKKEDAKHSFDRMSIFFAEQFNNNKALIETDKFSWYMAGLALASSNIKFELGFSSLVPMGKQCKLMIGNLDKKRMLEGMPTIKKVSEGKLRFAGDEFTYDIIEDRVLTHTLTPKSDINKIIGAYCRIYWQDGEKTDVYLNENDLAIAEARSKSPKLWKGKERGEMCKKSTYGRAWKAYYDITDHVIEFPEAVVDDDEELDYQYASVVDNEPEQKAESNPKQKEDDDAEVVNAEVVDEEDPDLEKRVNKKF